MFHMPFLGVSSLDLGPITLVHRPFFCPNPRDPVAVLFRRELPHAEAFLDMAQEFADDAA